MDGVSAVFAVVSLAIQLASTAQTICNTLRSIRDAPQEILRLADHLDQLQLALSHVKDILEKQSSVATLPSSILSIGNPLRTCEENLKKLQNLVDKSMNALNKGHRLEKVRASVWTARKKEEIQEIRTQVQESITALHFALSINVTQLQLHHIQITVARSTPTVNADTNDVLAVTHRTHNTRANEDLRLGKSKPNQDTLLISKDTSAVLYNGFFGRINVQKKSKTIRKSKDPHFNTKQAVAEQTTYIIKPSILSVAFELCVAERFGRISRTLTTYAVFSHDDPIFEYCVMGDVSKLQAMLSSGKISPFVEDKYGYTLLHHAALNFCTEMCSFLLGLGVDADRQTSHEKKALHLTRAPDVVRLLALSQDDITESDVNGFIYEYLGPAENTEFMLQQDAAQLALLDSTNNQFRNHALAGALMSYGRRHIKWKTMGYLEWEPMEYLEWEPIIRRLIRSGADIHATSFRSPKRQDHARLDWYPCPIPEYSTPLDELFTYSYDPFEAKIAADGWLEILESEGFDIATYIEKEIALHDTPLRITVSKEIFQEYEIPRQLVFDLGPKPSIGWDWYIDPASPAALVRTEFTYMNLSSLITAILPWRDNWPFQVPESARYFRPARYDIDGYKEWERLGKLADERANRRWRKKKAKAAKAEGYQWPSRMPGTWIA